MLKDWKKGALHTHSFWSDGRAFPEQVVLRHIERGFDFLCLSDHNNLGLDKQFWLYVIQPGQGPFAGGLPYIGGCTWQQALEEYERNFPGVPETKSLAGRKYVRVKSLPEVQRQFADRDDFLLIGGEELSFWLQTEQSRRQLHMGVLNVGRQLDCLEGETLAQALRRNKDNYDWASRQQDAPSLFVLNHPGGYYYDLEPALLIENDDIRHFELCNSNVDGENSDVNSRHPLLYGREKFWDIVNAHRVEDGKELLFAAAADDAHYYSPEQINLRAGLGHAWVMVHCPGEFSVDNLIGAMQRGDYYPSCGVVFESIEFSRGRLKVKIKAEPGQQYRIRFVSSKRGFSRKMEWLDLRNDPPRPPRMVPLYDAQIGAVAAEFNGVEAQYCMEKDDLYVRAVAVSDQVTTCRSMQFPAFQSAWTQPYC